MKNLYKTITIGIITLFFVITISPIINSTPIPMINNNLKEKIKIPIEIAIIKQNEYIIKETENLPIDRIKTLEDLIISIQKSSSEMKLLDLIENVFSIFDNRGIISNLLSPNIISGPIVFSIGKEKHFLPKFFPKIKTNELFHIWHYTNEWSTTLILFKQLSSSPMKILMGKQIGFMLGFKGIYFYIPKTYINIPNFNSELEEVCIFFGMASFAGGISY